MGPPSLFVSRDGRIVGRLDDNANPSGVGNPSGGPEWINSLRVAWVSIYLWRCLKAGPLLMAGFPFVFPVCSDCKGLKGGFICFALVFHNSLFALQDLLFCKIQNSNMGQATRLSCQEHLDTGNRSGSHDDLDDLMCLEKTSILCTPRVVHNHPGLYGFSLTGI